VLRKLLNGYSLPPPSLEVERLAPFGSFTTAWLRYAGIARHRVALICFN
jgi:hypothetical protein